MHVSRPELLPTDTEERRILQFLSLSRRKQFTKSNTCAILKSQRPYYRTATVWCACLSKRLGVGSPYLMANYGNFPKSDFACPENGESIARYVAWFLSDVSLERLMQPANMSATWISKSVWDFTKLTFLSYCDPDLLTSANKYFLAAVR
jgi:hypothetical protein